MAVNEATVLVVAKSQQSAGPVSDCHVSPVETMMAPCFFHYLTRVHEPGIPGSNFAPGARSGLNGPYVSYGKVHGSSGSARYPVA